MKRLLLFTMMCMIGMFSLNAQTGNENSGLKPVKWVTAFANETSVDVKWSMDFSDSAFEDFEAGSFITRNWKNDDDYPWVITEDAYKGSYAMKSSCEKVNDATSSIEIDVNVPCDGFVSFNHRISSEEHRDFGSFYIDGVLQTTISGNREWRYVELPITEGTHTYKWEYKKDDSRHTYGDSYTVDDIMFHKGVEVKEGWIGYDDDEWATSIGPGYVGPTYWGISFPLTVQYAGLTLSKIAVYDAGKAGVAQYTANIYLGGDTAPETLVSTQQFTLKGLNEFVEIELETPVAIDGIQPLWITLFCDQTAYPAAASLKSEHSTADWLSTDGKEWKHAYEYDLNVSWMLRGYVEDVSGNVRALASSEDGNTSAQKYNVYKKDLYNRTTELVLENTTATEYVDNSWETLGAGAYRWGVSSIYDTFVKKSVLTESFEDGEMPAGWGVYVGATKVSGSAQNWKIVEKYSELTPKDGEYFAVYTGKASNEYLVSSKMRVPSEATINFSYVNPKTNNSYSRLYLYASTSPDAEWTELWSTRPGKFVSKWTDVEVSLEDYEGQDIYLAFGNKYDGSWTAVDNVLLMGESGESDVVWSNTVSKDMTTELTVTVETDSGDPILGTVISLVNKIEKEYTYYKVLSMKDTYTFTDLRKGVYEVTISKDGYFSDYDGEMVQIWEPTKIDCYLSEDIAAVKNLYVSPTGWVMWESAAVGAGDEFIFDFEDMTLDGFVTIDADKDNYTWQNSIEVMAPGLGHDNSIACVTSMSWKDGKVLEPDNYLVTERKYKIDETSKLKFWVCSQDDMAPNEHYGVAVSLGSNDDPNDFVTIWEETLTIDYDVRGQSPWCEKVVDLSDYAGQEIHIALRHFNCTDEFYLNIDDISLETSLKKSRVLESYQVYLDGKLVAKDLTTPYYQHENLVDGQKYTTTVVPVYTMGDGHEASYTWRKVSCDKLEGVTDLTAEYTNGTTNINWTLPENNVKKSKSRGGEWLTYDNGEFSESIGLAYSPDEPLTFQWGIMFPAADMAKYANQYLTKVSLYDCDVYEGVVYIYKGGNNSPQILLYEQEYQCTGAEEYIEVEFESAVDISGKDNIWVVLENKSGGSKPAAGSVDCGNPNGRWIAYDGEWYDLARVSVGTFSWQIRAYITDEQPALPEAEILGVMLYRNDEMFKQLVQGESFVDNDAMPGDKYSVRVVYGGEKDVTYYAMSCPQTIVTDLSCPAPKDLRASSFAYEDGRYGTLLEYPYVPSTSEWLYYDMGSVTNLLGGIESFYYGVRFPVETLESYAGANITKVMFYDTLTVGTINDVTIQIYYGGEYAPEEIVHVQKYSGTGAGGFTEIELTTPLPISGEENIWVILKTEDGVGYPAAMSKDSGDPNARWYSSDGVNWSDVAETYAIDGSFMIRAFVTNESRSVALSPSTDKTLVKYNIYRGTTLDNIELVASTTKKNYFDEVEKGIYYYQVTAEYEEDGLVCESAPARAYDNYSQNYVVVEVTAIEENGVAGLMIYPNPTSGDLNINVEAMKRITIVNTLGQIVYDHEANGDNAVVDMSQYQTGMYVVRIVTDNGVAVKRISVVK